MKNNRIKNIIGASLTALAFSTMLSTTTYAQTCAAVPTCEDLGYDLSASDCTGKKALKCPFDKAKFYCPDGSSGAGSGTLSIGDILFSDMTTSSSLISGKTPIGIVFDTNKRLAVGLDTISVHIDPYYLPLPQEVFTSQCSSQILRMEMSGSQCLNGNFYYGIITSSSGKQNKEIIKNAPKNCQGELASAVDAFEAQIDNFIQSEAYDARYGLCYPMCGQGTAEQNTPDDQSCEHCIEECQQRNTMEKEALISSLRGYIFGDYSNFGWLQDMVPAGDWFIPSADEMMTLISRRGIVINAYMLIKNTSSYSNWWSGEFLTSTINGSCITIINEQKRNNDTYVGMEYSACGVYYSGQTLKAIQF